LDEPITYNIPVAMVDAYRGRKLIVRSRDPAEIIHKLADQDLEGIGYLQILGLGGNIDDLLRWEEPVPVDLVVEDPEVDLPQLYRYSPLLADRSVRASVPVVPGFGKVVKLALSLNFAVKLEPSQPGPILIEELLHVADLYLHQSTVSQPVEYIHSLFLAFYHGERISLWGVQEEDPSRNRFVTDQGVETVSKRFSGIELKHDIGSFIKGFTEELLSEKRECIDCVFLEVCFGYFKWPEAEYRCDGVKTLFETLRKAAEELKADLSSFQVREGEDRS
jgi:hypothetical protein